MNQVAIREESIDESIASVESIKKLCVSLMQTPHYRKIGEEGVFAIVQKAKALNINAMEALNGGLYFVQGKVGMSSEMMAAMIRQRGHSITKDHRSDDKVCILNGRRADTGDVWCCSFSMEDAKRAGLARGMYDKYPAIMLYNRAMSMLARQLFPDLIKGAGYTMEELYEIADSQNGRRVPSRPFVREDGESSAMSEAILTTVSKEQADALMAIIDGCDDSYQEIVTRFIAKNSRSGTVQDLPLEFYARILAAATKKRDEHLAAFSEPLTVVSK